MVETAVLINEFGEIGLDHQLVERIDENTVLLNAGCLCCTVQGDLVNALSDLFIKRVKEQVPYFRRVLIETTGLADPAPIIHMLMTAPVISNRYALDGIITTVDAMNADSPDEPARGIRQTGRGRRPDRDHQVRPGGAAKRSLRSRRGSARSTRARRGFAPSWARSHRIMLFDTGLYDPKTKTVDVQRWLREESYTAEDNGSRP